MKLFSALAMTMILTATTVQSPVPAPTPAPNDPRLIPVYFMDITDNSTTPPTPTTVLVCLDYTLWYVTGVRNDPKVLAWRCPVTTLPHRRRTATTATGARSGTGSTPVPVPVTVTVTDSSSPTIVLIPDPVPTPAPAPTPVASSDDPYAGTILQGHTRFTKD